MNIKWYRWVVVAALALVAIFFLIERYTRKTVPPGTRAVPDVLREVENPHPPAPKEGSFTLPLDLRLHEKAVFGDGLEMELTRIDDSRCPENTACVWAGELAAVLTATGGGFGVSRVEIRLGALTSASKSASGYDFSLRGLTPAQVSVAVTPSRQP